jgi:hypothetical protein
MPYPTSNVAPLVAWIEVAPLVAWIESVFVSSGSVRNTRSGHCPLTAIRSRTRLSPFVIRQHLRAEESNRVIK